METELTRQEKIIARLLAWGYTQKEIANKLFISHLTVQTHMKNIYAKLRIRKETDLTRWWIFQEYGIADNPFKKIVAIFFLLLSLTMILTEISMVRMFNARSVRISARIIRMRPSPAKRKTFYAFTA